MRRKIEKVIIALVVFPFVALFFAADLQDLFLLFPPTIVAVLVVICVLIFLFVVLADRED